MKKKFLIGFVLTLILLISSIKSPYNYEGASAVPLEDSVIINGKTYVSGHTDCNLEALVPGKLISRDESGVEAYEIVGQESREWIIIRGGIYKNSVFRRENISPVNFRDLPIDEIQLLDRKNNKRVLKTTKDKNTINELIKSIKTSTVYRTPFPDYAIYRIRIISPELKGIACGLEAGVDDRGNVYLVHRGRDLLGDEVTPAGALISRWIKGASSSK